MTEISELDVYNICHGTYDESYPFDHVFEGDGDDYCFVGLKVVGDISVVAFRGSTTILDWLRNITAFDTYSKGLGWGAVGFKIGLEAVMANIGPMLVGKRWIVTGHSRGAAEATDFAAEMKLVGNAPMAGMVLAPPKTGRQELRLTLASIPFRAYRNKNDPVPFVPFLDFHPYQMIDIDEPPPIGDLWGPVAPHHSELYGKAIAKLNPMPMYRT